MLVYNKIDNKLQQKSKHIYDKKIVFVAMKILLSNNKLLHI
jgi:hypothetical protein